MSFKSRLPLTCVLLIGVALLGTLLATIGWDRTWRVWNVQVAVQPFLDSQVITAGAASWGDGHDPLRFNPHDIGHRPMNYPRVWHVLFVLGLRPEHAEVLGWTLAALWLAGVWLAFPRLNWAEAGMVGLAVFSPAVLLGVERGNTDLAVFFVLAVALAVPRAAWNTGWIAVAFALKLFPLAAGVLLCGRPRRDALIGGGILAGFAVSYGALNFDDLRLISAGTPRDTWLSYGLNVLPMRLARVSALASQVSLVAAWAGAVVVIWTAGRAWLRRARADESVEEQGAVLDAFRVGAACYVGTFLLGNNFIYRLVFVVLVVPQLWRWMRKGGAEQVWAGVGLVAAMGSIWVLGFDRESWVVRRDEWMWFSIGQAFNCVLFGSVSYLLISSMPKLAVRGRKGGMGFGEVRPSA